MSVSLYIIQALWIVYVFLCKRQQLKNCSRKFNHHDHGNVYVELLDGRKKNCIREQLSVALIDDKMRKNNFNNINMFKGDQ